MSKALYAVGFMAMCAIVLVIHENTDHEQTKLNSDPFLASVEARVVAVAQHRLKKRLADDAAERHVSEARKAIKASLMDADADNQLNVQKYRAKQLILEEGASKKAAPKKAASNKAPKVKQYTWAEMQEGADAEQEKAKKADEDTHALMKGLLSAPKVDPDTVDTEGANMVTTDLAEEDTEEAPKKAAAKKVVQKVAAVAEDAVEEEAQPAEEEETEKAQPAEEKTAPTEAAVEEDATEDTAEEAQAEEPAAKEATPEKKAAPKKVAKKAATAPKKEAKAEKPAAAKKAAAPKKEAKKVTATEVKATVPEEEEDQEPVADGYNPDENPYAHFDEDDNDGDFSY